MLLLAAALLLRAIIPAGYMPAATGSGLLFELCPLGVSAEITQFLTGTSAQHHGHMDHGTAGVDDHECEIGHMLLSATAVDDAGQSEISAPTLALIAAATYSFASVSRNHYHSRGPPA